jgi:ArsR family transcriptional regulator
MSGKKDKASAPPVSDDRELLLVSKALSDPRRVKVLRLIAAKEGALCMDMRTCLAMNPATLSHHIKQLETAGLIETRRDGKRVRATLRRKAWKHYVSQIKAFVD